MTGPLKNRTQPQPSTNEQRAARLYPARKPGPPPAKPKGK